MRVTGIPLGCSLLLPVDTVNSIQTLKAISAGGGQMSTCTDLLRLGQLLLNKGKWLDADVRCLVCTMDSVINPVR
jgi:hypothetical protein